MSATDIRERIANLLSPDRARTNLELLDQISHRGPLGVLRNSIAGFSTHNGFLWASALTYTSSLSLVPILAVALSAVKGLGGVDRLRPVIERYLAVDSPQIADQILSFVGNINPRTLGAVGGASLLITVVLTLGTIENALNTIFNVTRGRTWLRKFSDYLSVTFTVPLLLAAAAGLRSDLETRLPHLPGVVWLAATMPTWAGFTFLYLFFPNTRVRWRYAALGGLIAAVLLEIGQWGYLRFQVGVASYRMTYGTLAAIPMLLTWIYMAWLIVLYGAELTAAEQGVEPSFDLDYRSPDFTRVAALLAVYRAGARMLGSNAGVCSVRALARELGARQRAVESVVTRLKEAGIIVEAADTVLAPERSHGIYLARDSETISLAEVLGVFEHSRSDSRGEPAVAAVIEGLNAAQREALHKLSVKDLVSGGATALTTQRPPTRSQE